MGCCRSVSESFHAELYLRLAGERQLLDGNARGNLPIEIAEIAEIAGALVAIDALSEDAARSIVEDYGKALALRGGSAFALAQSAVRSPGPTSPPTAARVAACDAVVDVGGSEVTVLFVSLRSDSAAVAVTMSFNPAMPGGGLGTPPLTHPGAVGGVHLTDDRGTTRAATFSGGGSPAKYRGELHTNQPLALDTKWIELDGQRMDLVESPEIQKVTLEVLEQMSAAEAHLWSRLAGGRHGPHGGPFPPQIEVAIDTLTRAGALEPGDPLIAEVRSVLEGFSGQPQNVTLREPWQSLLASQWRAATRHCVIPIGVVTPPIDERSVALEALVLEEGVLELYVRTPGALGMPWGPDALDRPLIWWAEDDLGNHYLGAPSRSTGGPHGASSTITYWPAVDDRARCLRVLPTAGRVRAVVEIPLPAKDA